MMLLQARNDCEMFLNDQPYIICMLLFMFLIGSLLQDFVISQSEPRRGPAVSWTEWDEGIC